MQNIDYLAEMKPKNSDDEVDETIQKNLEIGSGKSFITFAGAGSGKTHSLKKALGFLKGKYSSEFARQGKQVAVVTFTNNAADEIKDRVEKNPIFKISTIHSFCWSVISGFNEDIRQWYLETIPLEISHLEKRERAGRASKASEARKRNISRLTKKLDWLREARTFVYDPAGINASQNSLSHADVLKIFSYLILNKALLAEILVNKHPFIFVDESQDTNKEVINSVFELQKRKPANLVVGLFGDTMQRIFGGGESDLGVSKPAEDWIKLDKKMNHRSARRIVGLGNQIRKEVDGRAQFACEGAAEGFVRYFLIPQKADNKDQLEASVRKTMASITNDSGWGNDNSEETAILLLEHKMAGKRLGFSELWDKLSKSSKVRDRIAEGENAELNFFADIVFPLAIASKNMQTAEAMRILRENKSPLLDESVFVNDQEDPLSKAREAAKQFRDLVADDNVSFHSVLEVLASSKLLGIPEKLTSFITHNDEVDEVQSNAFEEDGLSADNNETNNDEIGAWAEALETNFYQVRHYKEYTEGRSLYRTHQGVKGNEFERVMVIMDDADAGGFMFSYEQYFEVKPLSASSQRSRNEGRETGLDRTRRLFYVTSTRAKSSLAHVIYTSDVEKLKKNLIDRKFAQEKEVICL